MLTSSISQTRIPNWDIFWWVRFFLFLHLMLALSACPISPQLLKKSWRSQLPGGFGQNLPERISSSQLLRNQIFYRLNVSVGGSLVWEWFGLSRNGISRVETPKIRCPKNPQGPSHGRVWTCIAGVFLSTQNSHWIEGSGLGWGICSFSCRVDLCTRMRMVQKLWSNVRWHFDFSAGINWWKAAELKKH